LAPQKNYRPDMTIYILFILFCTLSWSTLTQKLLFWYSTLFHQLILVNHDTKIYQTVSWIYYSNKESCNQEKFNFQTKTPPIEIQVRNFAYTGHFAIGRILISLTYLIGWRKRFQFSTQYQKWVENWGVRATLDNRN
jgi:hypothetical protein